MDYFIGLDLGQLQDYSALVLLERNPPTFSVRDLKRWPLQTKYTAIVKDVSEMLTQSALYTARLVVDATGVGRGVVDLFRNDPRLRDRVTAVTITAGQGSSWDGASASYHTPKKDLVGAIQVLMGGERLRVAKSLPLAQKLIDEMLTFRVKVNLVTGHESFESWREQDHDDLVLALAVSAWYAQRAPFVGVENQPIALTTGFQGGLRPEQQTAPEDWLLW